MCLKVELCCHLCGTCTSKKSRPDSCCQSLMHWTIAMTPLWFLYKFGKKFGWTPSTSMSGWCCAHNTHVVSGKPQHCNFGRCTIGMVSIDWIDFRLSLMFCSLSNYYYYLHVIYYFHIMCYLLPNCLIH